MGAEDRLASMTGDAVFPQIHREATALVKRDHTLPRKPGWAAWIRSNSARSWAADASLSGSKVLSLMIAYTRLHSFLPPRFSVAGTAPSGWPENKMTSRWSRSCRSLSCP